MREFIATYSLSLFVLSKIENTCSYFPQFAYLRFLEVRRERMIKNKRLALISTNFPLEFTAFFPLSGMLYAKWTVIFDLEIGDLGSIDKGVCVEWVLV